jgi:hypothetical protein
MPHGIRRMNWAVEPCPHTLSCFACGDDEDEALCEHLVVDLEDDSQLAEIQRINQNADAIVSHIQEECAQGSQQFEHFLRVRKSTASLIKGAKFVES